MKNLKYLKKIQEMEKNDWIKSYEKKIATRYAIQETIQICIDLAFHICAENNFGEPSTYRECFSLLAKNSLLEEDLAKKMKEWAGLRNLIAHVYEKIDDSRIFNIVYEDLDEISEFISIINNLDMI